MVGSWARNEELTWARENCPAEFKSPEKVGEATHKMVRYRGVNGEGVSIHQGAAFYNHQPRTLERMSRDGGVCGAVSKFAAGMSQAHGVPACPVGQPGHCAYLWWKQARVGQLRTENMQQCLQSTSRVIVPKLVDVTIHTADTITKVPV